MVCDLNPPCGRGQDTPERGFMSQNMVECESCPRAADRVKRNGTAAPMYTEMCTISTIFTTSGTPTQLVGGELNPIFANFARIQESFFAPRTPHWRLLA